MPSRGSAQQRCAKEAGEAPRFTLENGKMWLGDVSRDVRTLLGTFDVTGVTTGNREAPVKILTDWAAIVQDFHSELAASGMAVAPGGEDRRTLGEWT